MVVRIILSLGRFAWRNLVEKRYRFHQPGLGPIMHRVVGVFVFVVPRAPQRSSSMLAVFIYGIEKYVKGGEFFLVVLVIVRPAAHGFEARVRRRFAAAHHFHDGVPAGNFDVLLALARGARST